MKKFILCLLLCGQAFGACHVATKLGAGTKSGADWTNAAAWFVTSGFTVSTLTAGDSYYLGDTASITATLSGVTVVDATAKTITRASGSFVVDGVTTSHTIKFAGFVSAENSEVWLAVTNVTATVLTVSDPNNSLTNESSTSGAISYRAINATSDNYPNGTVTIANVTIEKAVASDHCTDTGWVVGTMGSGVAYFSGGTSSVLSATAINLTVNGNGYTSSTAGHGIVLDCTHLSSTSGPKCIVPSSGSTYTYVEAFGKGQPDSLAGTFFDIVVGTGTSNVTFDHVYFHHSSDCLLTYSGASNLTLRYSVLSDDYPGGSIHGGGTCGNASGNYAPVIYGFRSYYNNFRNITGTSNHDLLSASPSAPFVISNVTVATNVLTINGATFQTAALVARPPTAGTPFFLTGLTTATFLNSQVVYITSATSTQIVAAFTHADYPLAADTGNVIPANDIYEVVGETFSVTPGNTAAPGNGLFYMGIQTPGVQAVANLKFQNVTVANASNATLGVRAEDYFSGLVQNNLFINTTSKLQIPVASAKITITEDHNTATCAGLGASCYPAIAGVPTGIGSGTGDEVLNSTASPLTAGSFPVSSFTFTLTAHTTTGASLAYTDPNGVVAPQGGIYDRGAYLFVAAGNQLLTVSGLGSGNGTICSDGATCTDGIINCTSTAGVTSGTCTHTFTAGASVTLTETPTSGSFGGWSGACGGNASTCALTMNAPFTATGTFQIVPTCTLTLAANSLNSPATVSATTALTGLSGPNSFWFVLDPLSANISLCSYPYSGCAAAGQSGNLPYTVSGLYSLGACSNGVCCTGSTAPLNINTGAGSAAH